MYASKLLLTVFALGALAGGVRADESKAEGVRELAVDLSENVKAVLQKREQLGIRVGHFTGSGIDHAEAGGMLTSAVVLELGLLVNVKAKLELKADYYLVDDPKAAGVKVIKLVAVIKDLAAGSTVKGFPEFVGFVRKADDFKRLIGATGVDKPDGDGEGKPNEESRRRAFQTVPTKPGVPPKVTAFVKGSVVRAAEGSNYDVQILCGATAKGPFAPLTATLDDKQFPGLPFVEIPKGHYYQVRVKNNDACRLGIFLHLDGIDQFAFSEDKTDGRPKFKMWVVDAGKEITIEGYHKNLDPGEVFGFLTTEHGKGAASKFPTQSQGKVGTICLGLAREKQPGEKGSQETVPGDVIPFKQKVVEFKLGDINEFVTVRYSR